MPPFAKAPSSPGGHYSAPDFILVLNITNKGGSCVIKQRRLKKLPANSNQRELIQAAALTSPTPPTLTFILHLKARLADENRFSGAKKHFWQLFPECQPLHVYHFGLICMASRITPDHICLLGTGASYQGLSLSAKGLLLYVMSDCQLGVCSCQDVISTLHL